MEFIRSGGLVQIGDNLRIEAGPRMVTVTATEEVVHSLAAQASNASVDAGGEPTLLDSTGQPVVAGQDIQQLDWKSYNEGLEDGTVYYLYRLRERHEDEAEGHDETHIWAEEGVYDTEEQAISAALSMGG